MESQKGRPLGLVVRLGGDRVIFLNDEELQNTQIRDEAVLESANRFLDEVGSGAAGGDVDVALVATNYSELPTIDVSEAVQSRGGHLEIW